MADEPKTPSEHHPAHRVAEEAIDYRISPGMDEADPLAEEMPILDRITMNPHVMTGRPCIRGMRITVGTIVGSIAAGATREQILTSYPSLETADIQQALHYAAYRCSNERIMVVHE